MDYSNLDSSSLTEQKGGARQGGRRREAGDRGREGPSPIAGAVSKCPFYGTSLPGNSFGITRRKGTSLPAPAPSSSQMA